MRGEVIHVDMNDGRKETWTLADGTVLTMEVPASEPPITVKHAVYTLSSVLHGVHTAMLAS